MFHVYVLESQQNRKRYVGSTRLDPNKRLEQHNYGGNSWTRQNKPFKLIYTEKHKNFTEARKRELFLKTGVGRQKLNRILGG